jgi:IS5 family transposase
MRRRYDEQLPLAPTASEHTRGAELLMMGATLDAAPTVLDGVHADLLARFGEPDPKLGRVGMTAEQVLRAALVKQTFKLSYDELAFRLEDSIHVRAFARLSAGESTPKRSTLQSNISALRPETWESINRALVLYAKTQKVEDGSWMRTDATVVASNIHHPLDSSLLWDGVRVLTRIMKKANEELGTTRSNYARRAKRRGIAILNARTMEKRVPLYKDLLKVTHKTVRAAERAIGELEKIGTLVAFARAEELKHFLPLVAKVIAQTQRRVLYGESVPASDKIVSIFEPHTDIIVKDRRGTYYGHKVTLSTGRSGLVLDVVVEEGNPADSTLAVRAAKRHADLLGAAPSRAAFDGGFASKKNLEDIKLAGTNEVCFSKPAGVPINEMTTTTRIRNTLKRFRAGIEASISFLKRSFGWTRATWSGIAGFRSYVWASTVAHNLLVLSRALLARANLA